MEIGCNTLFPEGPLLSSSLFGLDMTGVALGRLARTGYDRVEYSHACHLSAEEACTLKSQGAAAGVRAWSVHAEGPLGFRLGDTIEEAQATLGHCVEVAAAAGAGVIVVHAPCCFGLSLPEGADLQQLAEQDLSILQAVLPKSRDLGVALALENGRALAHMAYILGLCNELAASNLGICVDTGHANLGDLGAPKAIRMAGRMLLTTHLHDNWGQRDDHLPPGQGVIDWEDVYAALREVAYGGTLMLELTDMAHDRAYDQALEMKQGLEHTRRFAGRYLANGSRDRE